MSEKTLKLFMLLLWVRVVRVESNVLAQNSLLTGLKDKGRAIKEMIVCVAERVVEWPATPYKESPQLEPASSFLHWCCLVHMTDILQPCTFKSSILSFAGKDIFILVLCMLKDKTIILIWWKEVRHHMISWFTFCF